MAKPTFIITCLGLFLIILVALIIGSESSNVEGFEYLTDLNNQLKYLKRNSNDLIAILNSLNQTKKSNDVQNSITNIQSFISESDISQIISGKEPDFLKALEDFRIYVSDISVQNNKKTIRQLKKKINKHIFKITNIVNDNLNNYNLPIELRQLLGKIWWDCTKAYDLISDDNDKLADEFKISYEMVTYYLSPKTFIIDSSNIGNPNDEVNKGYVYLIDSLLTNIDNVYNKEPSAMVDRSIIETDLDNLKTYVKTGNFPTPLTTAPVTTAPQLA